MIPRFAPIMAAWARSLAPNLERMFRTWPLTVGEILEIRLKVLAVVLPRLSVYACCRILLNRKKRCPQSINVVVVEERSEPLLPISTCCLTYPLERAEHIFPALSPERVTLGRVPLGHLPSVASAAGPSALFGDFEGRTPMTNRRGKSDSSTVPSTSRHGLDFSPLQTDVGSPGSRAGWFHACLGSSTAQGPGAPCDGGDPDVAFRLFRGRQHPGGPAAFAARS